MFRVKHCQLYIFAVFVSYAVADLNFGTFELYDDQISCGQFQCNATTQICHEMMSCDCRPGFEHNLDDNRCHLCPSEGHPCGSCCLGESICYRGYCQRCFRDQNGDCISQDSLFFLTAAQVALATAMVIGIAALATLLYKTFRARSRANNPNNQQILSSDLQNRSSLSRVSLTSIQIRVLRRLRDRPPKYETRHNYEFHQREQQTQTNPTQSPEPVTIRIGDPPPAYDEDVTSMVDFPPPYSAELPHPKARVATPLEATESTTNAQGSRADEPQQQQVDSNLVSSETVSAPEQSENGSEHRQAGIVNTAFVNDEEHCGVEVKSEEDNVDISTGGNDSQKVIHV
uniref:Uncharacterized protein n=2 Tax=Culex tarsalis TaxID=7177 RepID=A0A1Q3FJ67_CULTA